MRDILESKNIMGCYVFRFNPKLNKLDVMTTNLDRPNGIAFSHDEKKLYIADTGRKY